MVAFKRQPIGDGALPLYQLCLRDSLTLTEYLVLHECTHVCVVRVRHHFLPCMD
jgi:hypothetical protein